MGQAPSTPELPAEWTAILPNLTREAIIQSSYRYRTKSSRLPPPPSSSDDDNNNNDDDNNDDNIDDETNDDASCDESELLFDLDDHVPMALEILRAHPHLKDVRFKLVPGRMTEEKFWAVVFGILNDGGVDDDDDDGEDVEVDIGDDYETGDEIMDDPDHHHHHREAEAIVEMEKLLLSSLAQSPECHDDTTTAIGDIRDDTTHNHHHRVAVVIREQKLLISSLQKSLREANYKIRKLGLDLHEEQRKKNKNNYRQTTTVGDAHDGNKNDEHSGSIATCPKCNTPQTQTQTTTPTTTTTTTMPSHKGQWEMHPDCHEFLKLDAHLKENLRSEKEKRIKEVKSQMKFILDTDDAKDSYGKWSCCGKEEYGADGCCGGR